MQLLRIGQDVTAIVFVCVSFFVERDAFSFTNAMYEHRHDAFDVLFELCSLLFYFFFFVFFTKERVRVVGRLLLNYNARTCRGRRRREYWFRKFRVHFSSALWCFCSLSWVRKNEFGAPSISLVGAVRFVRGCDYFRVISGRLCVLWPSKRLRHPVVSVVSGVL